MSIFSKIPEEIKNFLTQLEDYVDVPLSYFGSIVRPDFIPGKSDIDAALFTDNTSSTMERLSGYLGVPRSEIIPFGIIAGGKSIFGNKIKYNFIYGKQLQRQQQLEFLVYDKKQQHAVMTENKKRFTLPLFISVLFACLKFLYYRLHIISPYTYNSLKRYLINDMLIGPGHTKFVLM